MTEADWTILLQPPVSDQMWGANFSQGQVSDQMWSAFRVLVNQSHLYSKHKDEAREARRMTRVRDPSSSKYARRSERGWQKDARSNDSKWHRAEFLAHEALNQMDKIGRESGSESPDERFSRAIIGVVGSLSKQTWADFSVTAIHGMDAEAFVKVQSDQVAEHLRQLRLNKDALRLGVTS